MLRKKRNLTLLLQCQRNSHRPTWKNPGDTCGRENVKRCDLLVVTRMDTLKSGWTPYVYYTTLYSIPSYTIFIRIYWGLFLEKWENQHRSTVFRAQYCFKNG